MSQWVLQAVLWAERGKVSGRLEEKMRTGSFHDAKHKRTKRNEGVIRPGSRDFQGPRSKMVKILPNNYHFLTCASFYCAKALGFFFPLTCRFSNNLQSLIVCFTCSLSVEKNHRLIINRLE